jgi:hypothetical protein
MTTAPSVILLHDGELEDVRELLEELGADLLHLRGGEIPERIDPPRQLFIATSRRAIIAEAWPASRGNPPRPFKIAIVSEDSNTLRTMLRRIGFDLLIRRPVHPYALRLLVLRALYCGAERRREDRVPVGYEVSYRTGVRRRKAMLVEFSARGCRLLTDRSINIGSRVTLDLPPEVTGLRTLQLRAKVIRSIPGQGKSGSEQHAVALWYDKLSVPNRRQLLQILKQRASGPLVLSKAMARSSGAVTESPGPAPEPVEESTPIAAAGSMEDRRKQPRAVFERSVTSLGEEAALVLMGRDLSVGGMRIEPNSELEVGTRLELAIYGAAREEPFIVRALVVRNDGEEGVGLRFENVPSGVAVRLESLVASLPSVESLQGTEADALGSVVSRILKRDTD